MDKKQTNKKEMFDSVNLFLDSNAEKWGSISKLAAVKNQFSDLIAQIEVTIDQQSQAKTYLGKNKVQLKKTIADKADILNDSLEAMALMENLDQLASRMSDTFSSLFRMNNIDFLAKVKEIIQAADEYTTVLTTDYGVSQEQIDGLKADTDRFAEVNGLPRAYQVASRQATQNLDALFSQAIDLLNNTLDKLMSIFRRRDAVFYNGYLASREIVDN
jgi:uncharacterized protein YdcH (DUF465 family)